ncbi:MAG: phospholipase [Candidatus Limisoma sp.]
MKGALIILAVTVAVGLILYISDRFTHKPDGKTADDTPEANDDTQQSCCGMHITCQKDSLVKASTEIVYYDDEELDRFVGITPDRYNDEQTEEFRDIMLTLLPDDIAGWARSLELRGIALPEIVRQELLMMVEETRRSRSSK